MCPSASAGRSPVGVVSSRVTCDHAWTGVTTMKASPREQGHDDDRSHGRLPPARVARRARAARPAGRARAAGAHRAAELVVGAGVHGRRRWAGAGAAAGRRRMPAALTRPAWPAELRMPTTGGRPCRTTAGEDARSTPTAGVDDVDVVVVARGSGRFPWGIGRAWSSFIGGRRSLQGPWGRSSVPTESGIPATAITAHPGAPQPRRAPRPDTLKPWDLSAAPRCSSAEEVEAPIRVDTRTPGDDPACAAPGA